MIVLLLNYSLLYMRKKSFFVRRKILKSSNYLNLTPVRAMSYEEHDENVTVLIPKFSNIFLKKVVGPYLKKPFIQLKLDRFGSVTWMLANGKNNVGEICGRLKETFGESIEPVHERTTKFITKLYQNDLITFKEILKEE
jgi:hypothetical protein